MSAAELHGQVEQLLRARNGIQLAKLFMAHTPSTCPPENDATDMPGLLAAHGRCQWLANAGQTPEAFKARERCIQMLLPTRVTGILSAERDFLLPVLKGFLLNLRDLALVADREDSRFGDKVSTHQQRCMNMMQRLYSEIFNDEERNFACITVYTVGWQCAQALNATVVVSKWRLPDRPYKMSDTVTARYYQGVSQFNNNNWPVAVDHLSFALRNIPAKYVGHRRCILWRLIPAKLFLSLGDKGGVGAPALFLSTGMTELGDLSSAFARGDVRAFEANLERNEALYVKNEVYLHLLKLRMLVYRNLLKRCYLVVRARKGDAAAARIPLRDLHALAAAAGWEVELDEMECLIGRLIADRMMRGKLDVGRKAIMFPSSKTPFPREK